jgi:outer membrane receptor protein involved in Fe transport
MENLDRIFTVFIPGITEFRQTRLRDNIEGKKPQRWYKGDFIIDLRAGYTFKTANNQSIKISGLVRNLANREYVLRPALVEAPRSYTLRIDLEF